jgi:transcriptional regulator with XRE-family HTH domain
MKTLSPIDAQVGARLRMRRRILGMSQAAVGEALRVSFQQVQKYENGSNRISASRLQQIADFLDVTPGYFFEDKRQSQVADLPFTSEGLQLSRAFAAVRDAEVRKRILDLIVSLASELH